MADTLRRLPYLIEDPRRESRLILREEAPIVLGHHVGSVLQLTPLFRRGQAWVQHDVVLINPAISAAEYHNISPRQIIRLVCDAHDLDVCGLAHQQVSHHAVRMDSCKPSFNADRNPIVGLWRPIGPKAQRIAGGKCFRISLTRPKRAGRIAARNVRRRGLRRQEQCYR